jgi:hypothetical protein
MLKKKKKQDVTLLIDPTVSGYAPVAVFTKINLRIPQQFGNFRTLLPDPVSIQLNVHTVPFQQLAHSKTVEIRPTL